MVNVNELEKQCNEIKTKLNNHGSAVKDIVKEFSEFDHDYSEEDYNNVKSLIKNSIDELTKEKGRLSNLNNDASNLASSLMTTEKELNDKMDKLREMSDYYWDKLYAARKEGEEAERELNSMNSKMAEAEKMYRDAVEERNRRREFTPWTLVKILIPPLFIVKF
jgi:chromosome segregation ATPase